jgi:hypothetical protein
LVGLLVLIVKIDLRRAFPVFIRFDCTSVFLKGVSVHDNEEEPNPCEEPYELVEHCDQQ